MADLKRYFWGKVALVMAASVTSPIVQASTWQLSYCSDIDRETIMGSFFASGKFDSLGNAMQSFTCLNEMGDPVKTTYVYSQAERGYSSTERPLTRAERIGAFFRTQTGEYVFVTGTTLLLAALTYKAYGPRFGKAPTIEGLAPNAKASWLDRFSSVRVYENTSTGERKVTREFRFPWGKLKYTRSTKNDGRARAYDPKNYPGPTIDGEVVRKEFLD